MAPQPSKLSSENVKFTRAIVRPPGPSLVRGLTTAGLGRPDYHLALEQHEAYVRALELRGLEVIVLEPEDVYPDSTFVEDTALLIPECALIMRPGAPSRRGETRTIAPVLNEYFNHVEQVQSPGTAEGGDIMIVGNHAYIGLSQRTSPEGARQIIEILGAHGMTGSTIPLSDLLHLKSAVAYLEDNRLVVTGELRGRPEFSSYAQILIDAADCYAANCVWINGTVLVASGYPKARRAIEAQGLKTVALDMSEFRKLDGGLSCLSLRF